MKPHYCDHHWTIKSRWHQRGLENNKNDSVIFTLAQRAKKVVSDSLGLVDFAFGLLNSVFNLPNGQVNFLGKFKLQKDCNQSC